MSKIIVLTAGHSNTDPGAVKAATVRRTWRRICATSWLLFCAMTTV
ncbi:Uncharacterised protein [Neisseria meningitidis]|nr:Uncharacterised protein [Neisseria meningitidis]